MPHVTSVDFDALEGHGYGHVHTPSALYAATFAGEDFLPSSASSIAHAYGTDPSSSALDQLYYDQDLPWPVYYISQHPSSRHYDAHFYATATLPRLGRAGSVVRNARDATHVGSLAMTLLQSCGCHLRWARKGLSDANRWSDAWRLISSSPQIRTGVVKGLLLSSAVSLIVFFFESAFFPTQLFQRQSAASAVSAAHEAGSSPMAWVNTLFLYPLIGGCYLLASSWTTEVAQAAYDMQREKAKKGDGERMSAMAKGIAEFTPTSATYGGRGQDGVSAGAAGPSALSVAGMASQAYRFVLVANYSLLSLGINKICALLGITWISYLGAAVNFGLISFVDSYYCFELLWMAKGWGFEKRARFAEMRWSYMVAFGIPSTLVSYFHPSGLLNLMLFMLVFPFCSVLALLADPVPHDTTILQTLLPGRLCLLLPTVRVHRWLVRNIVSRATYGRMGLSDSAATATAAALGSSFHRAFSVGKTSNAARFARQIWNDTTQTSHGGYMRSPQLQQYRNGWGGGGANSPKTEAAYGQALLAHGISVAAQHNAGDNAACGYANATQPPATPRIGNAPPPRRTAATGAFGAVAATTTAMTSATSSAGVAPSLQAPLAPPPQGLARDQAAAVARTSEQSPTQILPGATGADSAANGHAFQSWMDVAHRPKKAD